MVTSRALSMISPGVSRPSIIQCVIQWICITTNCVSLAPRLFHKSESRLRHHQQRNFDHHQTATNRTTTTSPPRTAHERRQVLAHIPEDRSRRRDALRPRPEQPRLPSTAPRDGALRLQNTATMMRRGILALLIQFEVRPLLPPALPSRRTKLTTAGPHHPSRNPTSTPPPPPTTRPITNEPQILRRPGFHRFVGRIHRTIDEKRHGPSPDEPLRPGEATEEPGRESFISHFAKELRNQARGKASKDDHDVTRR